MGEMKYIYCMITRQAYPPITQSISLLTFQQCSVPKGIIDTEDIIEENAISNGKVIELVQQLKSEKAHGKNYIKVTPLLVHHLLRNRLLHARSITVRFRTSLLR